MEVIKIKKIYSQKGNTIITTPIISTVAIFILLLIFIIMINYIMPFFWYQKLTMIASKYMFVIENYGYMTEADKKELLKELQIKGFDIDKTQISYTNEKVSYGNEIYLKIVYEYEYKMPLLQEGFGLKLKNNVLKMEITKNGICKV